MSKAVEFYYDVGSPASYLAFTQLPLIASKYGADLVWCPILLGGIFKAVGNRSPVEVVPKGRYMLEDLMRYAKRYQVPFRLNSFFPINTLNLMRGAVAIQMHEPLRHANYAGALFRAIWVEDKNLNDPAVFAEVATEAGFNAEKLGTWISDPSVKQKLIDVTAAAVDRGLFGVPTMFVSETMFFGQDRLDFVGEALAG